MRCICQYTDFIRGGVYVASRGLQAESVTTSRVLGGGIGSTKLNIGLGQVVQDGLDNLAEDLGSACIVEEDLGLVKGRELPARCINVEGSHFYDVPGRSIIGARG